jgi:ribonucleoside-diphosphate reductase beta chain
LPDTDTQVKYTRNEETIHAMVGMKLVNTIREEYPELFDLDLEAKILEEAEQAFVAESKIIDWMVNGIQEENLSAAILKEFVKSRINDSLKEIGFKQIFSLNESLIEKTSWFKEELLANTLTDFFKKRPTEYSKNSQSFTEDDLF